MGDLDSGAEKQQLEEAQTSRRIAEDLRALGIRSGRIILVHAALRSLGPVPGGAETVVRGLLEGIGQAGTLLMPALTWEQRPTNQHDTRETPSHVGALAEYFRTRSGTKRSVHPTHSVCGTGPAADDLLSDHYLDATPCGPRSPFRKLTEANGWIVMLGCGLKPNTTMHALEELAEPPYLFGPDQEYQIVDGHGEVHRKIYRTHGFAGVQQRYERIEALSMEGAIVKGQVLGANTYVINAPALRAAVVEKLTGDPLYFVDSIPESQ